MARVATANMAWQAGRDWKKHPLTCGRIDEHLGRKNTQQLVQRTLPPQCMNTSESLVSRLVEMWEKLPEDITSEKIQSIAKKKICEWAKRIDN